MTQNLVITTLGSDRPGICNQVVRLVTQSGCNIVDSRIALFGNEFTLVMLLSGSNQAVTRIETMLPLLGQEHDLITMSKRTSPHQYHDNTYTVEVFVEAEDRIGLTEKFTQFFADRHIDLGSLSSQILLKEKLQSRHDLCHMNLTATLTAEHDPQQLQLDFDALCSQLNVQGSLRFIQTNPHKL